MQAQVSRPGAGEIVWVTAGGAGGAGGEAGPTAVGGVWNIVRRTEMWEDGGGGLVSRETSAVLWVHTVTGAWVSVDRGQLVTHISITVGLV